MTARTSFQSVRQNRNGLNGIPPAEEPRSQRFTYRSIRKRTGRAGYWVDWYDGNGKRRLKRFTRKEDTEKAERATLVARDRGDAPIFADGKVSIKEAAEKYLHVGKWVPKERTRVEEIFRLHLLPFFGGKLLSRVKRLDVEEYVAHRLGQQKPRDATKGKPKEKSQRDGGGKGPPPRRSTRR